MGAGKQLKAGLALLLALTLPVTSPAFSQAEPQKNDSGEVEPLFIDLTADPTPVWANEPVRLTGQTMGGEGVNTVSVLITYPEIAEGTPPEQKTVTADIDPQGAYSLLFEQTMLPGTYKVEATAPDKRGKASAEFQVIDATDLPEQMKDVEDVPQLLEDITDTVTTRLDDVPDSPGKDEVKAKLVELKAKLGPLQEKWRAVTAGIQRGLGASAGIPEMSKPRRQLIGALKEVKEKVQRTEEELKRLKTKAVACDNLEVIIEGFKLVSTMMDFIGTSVFEIGKNFFKEFSGYLAGKADTAVGSDEYSGFVHVEAAKNYDSVVSLQAELPTAMGIATDGAVLVAQKVMAVFCQVFTGPVTAHMKAEFYQGNRLWWSYEMDLTGLISVHYPKDAGGGAIPVAGRIEGFGTHFKMWENALSVMYPNLMDSAVQRKRMIPPIDMGARFNDFTASLGSVAAGRMPNSFFIAVSGTVENGKMTLKLGPARTDMSPKAIVLAIILSPLVTFPVMTSYALPYKDAHFVLERATAGADMEFDIENEKDKMIGHQTWAVTKDGGEAKGEYRLDIKVCNPNC